MVPRNEFQAGVKELWERYSGAGSEIVEAAVLLKGDPLMKPKPETSLGRLAQSIVRERDELRAKVEQLQAALSAVDAEADYYFIVEDWEHTYSKGELGELQENVLQGDVLRVGALRRLPDVFMVRGEDGVQTFADEESAQAVIADEEAGDEEESGGPLPASPSEGGGAAAEKLNRAAAEKLNRAVAVFLGGEVVPGDASADEPGVFLEDLWKDFRATGWDGLPITDFLAEVEALGFKVEGGYLVGARYREHLGEESTEVELPTDGQVENAVKSLRSLGFKVEAYGSGWFEVRKGGVTWPVLTRQRLVIMASGEVLKS